MYSGEEEFSKNVRRRKRDGGGALRQRRERAVERDGHHRRRDHCRCCQDDGGEKDCVVSYGMGVGAGRVGGGGLLRHLGRGKKHGHRCGQWRPRGRWAGWW